MHQDAGRLLARRADAEVRPGDDHVARAHAERELGTHCLEAMACGDFDAVLHRRAGGELVGVDVGGEFPGPHAWPPSVAARARRASISRASLIAPHTAEAATV